MRAMASQITGASVVYSTVCSTFWRWLWTEHYIFQCHMLHQNHNSPGSSIADPEATGPLIWLFHKKYSVQSITMTSQWVRWRLKPPASRLLTQPCHWPLWGEVIGHRWIPFTKGQQRGKCFHDVIMSVWSMFSFIHCLFYIIFMHRETISI